MSQFSDDLALGGAVEDYVLESLRRRNKLFNYAHRTQGAYKGADIVLNLSVEVKYDVKSGETGNVAIETSCNGKASGVTASTSALWVVVVPQGEHAGMWCVPTAELRFAISGRNSIPAGDGKAARVVLLPVADLIHIRGAWRIADAPDIDKSLGS